MPTVFAYFSFGIVLSAAAAAKMSFVDIELSLSDADEDVVIDGCDYSIPPHQNSFINTSHDNQVDDSTTGYKRQMTSTPFPAGHNSPRFKRRKHLKFENEEDVVDLTTTSVERDSQVDDSVTSGDPKPWKDGVATFRRRRKDSCFQNGTKSTG